MRVGVPKEIKVHEYRVGLTPASVAELVAAGHDVIVETESRHSASISPTRTMSTSAPHRGDTAAVCSPAPT